MSLSLLFHQYGQSGNAIYLFSLRFFCYTYKKKGGQLSLFRDAIALTHESAPHMRSAFRYDTCKPWLRSSRLYDRIVRRRFLPRVRWRDTADWLMPSR